MLGKTLKPEFPPSAAPAGSEGCVLQKALCMEALYEFVDETSLVKGFGAVDKTTQALFKYSPFKINAV